MVARIGKLSKSEIHRGAERLNASACLICWYGYNNRENQCLQSAACTWQYCLQRR